MDPLSRAYGVGVNASGDPVVTGIGTYNGASAAFLITVPRWLVSVGNKTANYGTTATFNLKTNATDSMTFQ